jgi:DNA or RNA helicases of superfamily II
MTRDERQKTSVKKFIATGGRGCLVAVTAFGKTRIALHLIRHTRRSVPTRKAIVIVPTENLKEQWEEELRKEKLDAHSEVIIINTAIKRKLECDLLIIDEIHRTGAETFSRIFDTVKYRFILGLTGTLKRLDKKHKVIEEKCPVFDVISLKEARANGWVSDFLEVNLGLHLPPADLIWYKEIEEKYNKAMDLFDWDFGVMFKCGSSIKPLPPKKTREGTLYIDPPAVAVARSKGWKGNSAYTAWQKYMDGEREAEWWGHDFVHAYHPKKIAIIAVNGIRSISAIRKFVSNHPSKVTAALEILGKFERKTITFAESTAIADELTKKLNEIPPFPLAKSYHSALSPIIVAGKKLSKKATGHHVLESFRINDCTILNTAKKLDEGADFPSVTQGVRLAGTSSPTQQTQRRGRIIRAVEGKFALMWNIYLIDTMEVRWLKRSQNYSSDILWTENIDEVLEILHEADE